MFELGDNEMLEKNDIFTIECEDIILREFQMEDLDSLYKLTLQPEITDILPDWIGTREQYKDWIENKYIKGNMKFKDSIPSIGGRWISLGIILKETNEFIGWCCNGESDEMPIPNRDIGYAISKYHRNKGYVTQAVKGLIKYLFDNTDAQYVDAIALINNGPSNRVIEKCGFKYIEDINIGDKKFHRYKLKKKK